MLEQPPTPFGGEIPSVTRRRVVVLRTDVVEFTSITDAAVAEGLLGAERLATVIDTCIGRLAEIVNIHDGYLSAIAGDAIVAVWPLADNTSLSRAALLAVQAAEMAHAASLKWRFEIGRIQLRSSIACGELDEFRVGGADLQWHRITSGPALAEAVEGERAALPNQIVVSPLVWEQVQEGREGTTGAGGTIVLARTIQAVGSNAPPLQIETTPPPSILWSCPSAPDLTSSDSSQGGEFRQLSVIFSQLRTPFYAQPEDALRQLQAVARQIQEIVRNLEGSVYQITADESVTTAVVVFGVSPWAHEDDATRAVAAAVKLHKAGGDLGVTTSSGVATGKLYCTTYGHNGVRTPAIVGPAMNLAARLMQTSQGVVCDASTARASRRHHRFQLRELAPRILKGKASPVTAYVPIVHEAPELLDHGCPLVGRAAELRSLEDALSHIARGSGSTCLIAGEAGLGKSALVGEVVRSARVHGVQCLIGRADPTEDQVAYAVWRNIYKQLLGAERTERALPDQTLHAAFYKALEEDAELAPLLNDVLLSNFGETLATSRLTGETRSTRTRDVLVRCMARASRRRGLIVVIEDLHWADTSSLALLVELAEAMLPLLVVATYRPTETIDSLQKRLMRAPRCAGHTLHALTEQETGEMLARWLWAESCEFAAATLVHRRVAGNPLFVEEMGPFLLDRHILSVRDGHVSMSMPADVANAQIDLLLVPWGAPGTLESVVLARFDRLAYTDKLVLRAASVMGVTCRRNLLYTILADVSQEHVSAAIAKMEGVGFLIPNGEDSVTFKHVLLRDVIYNSFSFADRRRYHGVIAEWIKRNAQTCGGSDDAVLAHHYRNAGDSENAIRYLQRAGYHALQSYANFEAFKLLGDALELATATRELRWPSDKNGEALLTRNIELGLAKASLGLSRYEDTKQHSERGLALLGFPVPTSALRLLPAIAGQIVIQAKHCIFATKSWGRATERHAAAAAAASALEGLTEACFYRGEAGIATYAALRTLNLAEQWTLLPEQARGYATLAGITSLSPLRGVAAHYRQRALETLTRLDDPSATVWVHIVVGLSLAGTGEWEQAKRLLTQAATVAEDIGDRRRWRDGVENVACIAACQGNCEEALDGVTAMQVSAARDKDQRYEVLALREQGFYLLHLGRRDEAWTRVREIGIELERGVTAEEGPTRQDQHALSGTLALEGGDLASARASADAALNEVDRASVATSFPFTYWSCFLVARIYLNLLIASARLGGRNRDLANRLALSCRALERQARIHPIAAPAARLLRGGFESVTGKPNRARRTWERSAADAERLRMRYELALTREQLAAQNTEPTSERIQGLPLIAEALP